MSRFLRWAPALAVTMAIAAGCSDQDSALAPRALAPTFAAAEAGKPMFVANAVRYQNTGKASATGRDGSVTVTARALIGKDGVTLVEATTGQLDGDAAAPGNLDRVQVKGIIDPALEPVFTANYRRLQDGGYFAASYEGLGRGAVAQVQANVSGIDNGRTARVSVDETVKLRPDLSAALTAPTQAYVGADVHIAAVVTESNGDVGATSACVLYVDGAEADRADGIWVDASGTVSCAFATRFAAVGDHQLRVALEDVVPGDWDAANNAASASITIVDAVTPLSGFAEAEDISWNSQNAWTGSYEATVFGSAARSVGRQQRYRVNGSFAPGMEFPVSASIEERSGGSVVNTAGFTAGYGNGSSYYCAYQAGSNGDYLNLCTHVYGIGYGSYEYGRHAGAVTYYSSNYAEWTGSSLNVYSWNYESENANGQFAVWASEVSPTLHVVDAGGQTFRASPQIPLQPYNHSYAVRQTYWDWYFGGYTNATVYAATGRTGASGF